VYWVREGRTLVLSSHLRSLLDAQSAPSFDEERMTRYLWGVGGPDETMYTGVSRLPAGHHARLTVDASPRVERWFWPQRAEPSARADFPDVLRQVIEEAVDQSLPASGQVASHLSGGLDSTIVAAIAAKRAVEQGTHIQALSHLVAPERWPDWMTREGDDTPFVEAFARATPGVTLHRFDVPGRPLLSSTKALFESSAYPILNPINAPWILDIKNWIRDHDVALVLTGVHGSLGYSISRSHQYRRAIAAGQFGLLSRDAKARHAAGARWRHIASTTAQEFAPRLTSAGLRVLGRVTPQAWVGTRPLLITPRPPDAPRSPVGMRDRHWWTQSVLLDTVAQSAMQYPVAAAWESDPLGDSEVLRALFSAPPSAWLGDGMDRALARRTMKGLVVDDVRLRAKRGLQSADFGFAVQGQQAEYRLAMEEVSESPLAQKFIDIPRLQASMDPEVPHRDRAALGWQLSEGRILGFGMYLAWIERFLRHSRD